MEQIVEESVESCKIAEDTNGPNVMSVELAIKRELAYRRKVENLKMRALGSTSTLKPSIIVGSQGPPISAGTKRKAPTSNLKSFIRPPAPQPSPRHQLLKVYPGSLSCTACRVDFSSVNCLKQHCLSKSHRLKIMMLKNQGNCPSNPLLCSLCQAPSSSVYQIEVHLTGARHTACLQGIEKAKNGQ